MAPDALLSRNSHCDGDPQRPRSGYFGQPRGSGGNCPTGRLNFGSVYDQQHGHTQFAVAGRRVAFR